MFKKLLLTALLANVLCSALAQNTQYNLTDAVSISASTLQLSERWPTPSIIAIKRSGGFKALTVNLSISGTATLGTDYRSNAAYQITIPMGKREVWIVVTPEPDQLAEAAESIRFTISPSSRYSISGGDFAEITLTDAASPLTDQEAVRFLNQAGFGADPDELADVKTLGLSGWIDTQIARPKGYTLPAIVSWRAARNNENPPFGPNIGQWMMVMRRRYPSGSPAVDTDILRHKVANSLLQIFVISSRADAIFLETNGMCHYYDRLLDGALGNFRQILFDVSMHPIMGKYLSHLGNKKPNLALNQYPDENYAREIMQLFSIGLVQLNQDGSPVLDSQGKTIPTYNNADISQFARVFTGLDFSVDQGFPSAWVTPMRTVENLHDTDPKNLLGTPIPGGQTTLQDINAAIDVLFNHPNTPPFICKQLIQKLVTSNPSPAYISRIAAVFINNGNNQRGDMAAVVKAILLDDEARNFQNTKNETFGKMREPYNILFNMAKTFNAQPATGDYINIGYMYDLLLQEPFFAPSVFNFYKPTYASPGAISALDMYSPEFQILTSGSVLSALNLFKGAITNHIARWTPPSTHALTMDFSNEIPLATDPDAVIRQLCLRLGVTLSPSSFQYIREAILKFTPAMANWQTDRVKLATILIVGSPEFYILR
jgi:uncharacterized protein (DUF1800 family)